LIRFSKGLSRFRDSPVSVVAEPPVSPLVLRYTLRMSKKIAVAHGYLRLSNMH